MSYRIHSFNRMKSRLPMAAMELSSTYLRSRNLLERIIEWAKQERLDRLVLHASEKGRNLYERLGFVATNEMRFAGD